MIFDNKKEKKKKALTFTTTQGSTFTSITKKNIQKNLLEEQRNQVEKNMHDTTKDEVKK